MSDISTAISRKQCKIGGKLLLITNRKSYMSFRLVPTWMTLNGVMALFSVISANWDSFRAQCAKVHVRYLISWWVLVIWCKWLGYDFLRPDSFVFGVVANGFPPLHLDCMLLFRQSILPVTDCRYQQDRSLLNFFGSHCWSCSCVYVLSTAMFLWNCFMNKLDGCIRVLYCGHSTQYCIVWNAHNTVLGEEALLIYIVPVCYVKTGRYGKT